MKAFLYYVLVMLVATPAHAYVRKVTFVNASTDQVVGIYVADPVSGEFGENILPKDYKFDVTEKIDYDFDIPDGGRGFCRFDIHVKYRDGRDEFRYGVNICEKRTFRIKDYR